VLSAPLAAVLCVGLLYSLGAGVTAHPSEFDFFLTADVRPREYLLADLAFQFVSLLAAVGMAAGLAAVAMVHAVGRPIAAALPMFGILAAYSALVLLTSQVLVVLRVRYPKVPVRLLTVLLFGFSLIPALGIVRPDFPIRFTSVPIPSTAFASLGLAILRDAPPSLVDLAIAAAFGGMRTAGAGALTVTQTLTFLLGILAINWAFYERENLWTLVTTSKSPGAYFRGLMLSFAAIGLAMTAGFLALLVVARPSAL